MILFRCEFGTQYGFGHLMRSVALAQAFQEKKQVQTFCFSSSCVDGFNELFDNANMAHIQLPRNTKGLLFDPNNYIKLSGDFITIFDNYDVTEVQMINYKHDYPNLVAIDDLANRVFNVDLIINQNLGSDQLEYKTINQPKFFLGVKYALLRKNILKAERKKNNNRIFMSFGGGEVYTRIRGLLGILLLLDKELDVSITVDFVISGKRDNKEQIRTSLGPCKKLKFNFIENQMDLSSYMVRANFAVTAAGSTVYELACLGVPQIVFIIDKNQKITGQKINETGLGSCLGDIRTINFYDFQKIFISFLENEEMKTDMSRRSQSLIDDKGTQRVANGILKHYGYN